MSDMDPAKLKVVELRAELAARGLDTKGNKPFLVERLQEALDKERMEGGGQEAEEEEEEGDEEEEESPEDEEEEEEEESAPPPQPQPRLVLKLSTSPPKATPVPQASPEPVVRSPPPVQAPPAPAPRVPTPPPVKEKTPPPVTPPRQKTPPPPKVVSPPAPKVVSPPPAPKVVSPPPVAQVKVEPPSPAVRSPPPAAAAAAPPKVQSPPPVAAPPKVQSPPPAAVKAEPPSPLVTKPVEPAVTVAREECPAPSEPAAVQSEPVKAAEPHVPAAEPMETDAVVKQEPPAKEGSGSECGSERSRTSSQKPKVLRKVDPELLPKEGEEYPVMDLTEWDDEPSVEPETGDGYTAIPFGGKKRAHSESPEPEAISAVKKVEEDEPDLDEKAFTLSWYDSDLNLKIDKSGLLAAQPMHEEGFAFIWAGARSSFGVSSGQSFFEVKVEKHLDVSHLTNEEFPHVLRVGWSIPAASMQLGEENLSFGYGGSAKVSCNNRFRDYGKPFSEGDVVGAFLDISEEKIRMSFTVNGEDQGLAFEVPSEKLNDQPLFPHVLSKNCRFSCNFGAVDPSFPPSDPRFVAVSHLSQLVPGPQRPATKSSCEMIMMCGLPGCGKTTWANKYSAEHPEKNFNILGTNNLIDKMKVMGLPRRRNYAGRWEELIKQCTAALNKLLEVASGRRRNYILDQTNVYPTAQRRKMKSFEGYVRRAVVIVPTDEEFKRRVAQREAEEGKDVPDSAVLEMKANFQLPVKGDPFSEVVYVELDEAESRRLLEQYNKEGADAGYAPANQSKRPRFEGRGGGSRFTDRDDNKSSRFERGGDGWGDTGGSGGADAWGRGGGGGGGWDRRGGWDRDRGNSRGGWGDSQGYRGRDGGGGGGGWRGDRGGRDRDRGDSRGYGRDGGGYGGGRDGGRDGGGYGGRDYGSRDSGGYGGRDSGYRGGGGGGGGYDRNRSQGGDRSGGDRRDRWGGSSGGGSGGGGSWSGAGGSNYSSSGSGYGSGGRTAGGYGGGYSSGGYSQPSAGGYGGYQQQQQQQYGGYTAYPQAQQQGYQFTPQTYAGGWGQQPAAFGGFQAAQGGQAAPAGQYAQYAQYQQYAGTGSGTGASGTGTTKQ